MIANDQVTHFSQVVQDSESVLIVFPAETSSDIIASASALYVSLKEQGKRVSLATPRKPENLSIEIESLDELVTEIGNQNLSISFDYNEDAVDKVSYHIGEDTGKFYLTIKPKHGFAPLDASTVEYDYTGLETDLLILVGVKSLQELEQLYFGYEDTYENSHVIAINSNMERGGVLHIDTENGASVSEHLTKLLGSSPFEISVDTAINLLRGLEAATDHFASFSATADTFEAAAILMRSGARRSKRKETPVSQSSSLSPENPPRLPEKSSNNIFGQQKSGSDQKEQRRESGFEQRSQQNQNKSGKKTPGSLKFQPNDMGPKGG